MNQNMMRAIVVLESGKRGDWNSLALKEVPVPKLRDGEVLVQVEACSVNRADLLQRRGLYPPPPGESLIMGLDFAGTVVEHKEGSSAWSAGDRVFGIVAGGGYGRFVQVAADHLLPVPENMSFVEAAAAAEVFFTAFYNLFMVADMTPGETLLIHGGASGVGTAAIQLTRENGIACFVSAGTEDNLRRCLSLGAAGAVNYKEEDTFARVLEMTGNKGVDVVLDWIGASHLNKNLEVLKTKGRLVVIGLMGGNKGEIQLAPLLSKRISIIGSILRSQSKEEKAVITRAFREKALPLLASGRVRPVIECIFPIESVEEAHRTLQEGGHFGKVVLTWS